MCEYCHSPEEASAALFGVDHIQPKSLGGLDTFENLALACQRCNNHRYNFTEGIDPESQVLIQLFNPRQQEWNEHFSWGKSGLVIRGMTPTGRATCSRLDLNDQQQNDGAIVKARRLWLQGGWHPPLDDAVDPEDL